MVVASIYEGDAKGPEPAMLGVALFQVAQAPHELLTGDLFVVCQKVALSGLAGVVNEDVGIGGHAGDGADHVTVVNQPFEQ